MKKIDGSHHGVKVSDRDLKKLYKQHMPLYKQTPNRAIKYVAFDIKPSEDDFKAAETLLQNLQEEFRTTEDVSLVVNTNSDIMYDGRDFSEETQHNLSCRADALQGVCIRKGCKSR